MWNASSKAIAYAIASGITEESTNTKGLNLAVYGVTIKRSNAEIAFAARVEVQRISTIFPGKLFVHFLAERVERGRGGVDEFPGSIIENPPLFRTSRL
jgi:hypothetical protein